MWRSFRSCDTKQLLYRYAAMVTVCVALLSCAAFITEEQVGLNEPIEMGPWTFEVQRATEKIEGSSTRYKKITVSLKLHNYRERHQKPFDDFLNGTSKHSVNALPQISFPRLHVDDGEGNVFDGSVTPMSGGSLRSEHGQAQFSLISLSMREILSANEDTPRLSR